MDKIATLILEDGSIFKGKAFGATGESIGEIVFNTSMIGYQEILTDPSYFGQFVVMTYPLIGNYGVNMEDYESDAPHVFGFIVREHAEKPSHWRNKKTLDTFLIENNIIGISEIDTRMITKKIREKGTMKALLTTNEITLEEALKKLEAPLTNTQVEHVSIQKRFVVPGRGLRIALLDYGYKKGILRELVERNCEVTVFPYNTPYEEISKIEPDGVLLSNGPGDPKDVEETLDTIKEIISHKIPMFGICLGHQLFALASGADTKKLKFGHRGGNHPVKDISTNKIYMTSQNHGYAVTKESLNNTDLNITHLAVNDGTVEGLSHSKAPAFSVQYHPEASPGPYDNNYLFEHFINLINTAKEDKSNA